MTDRVVEDDEQHSSKPASRQTRRMKLELSAVSQNFMFFMVPVTLPPYRCTESLFAELASSNPPAKTPDRRKKQRIQIIHAHAKWAEGVTSSIYEGILLLYYTHKAPTYLISRHLG